MINIPINKNTGIKTSITMILWNANPIEVLHIQAERNNMAKERLPTFLQLLLVSLI